MKRLFKKLGIVLISFVVLVLSSVLIFQVSSIQLYLLDYGTQKLKEHHGIECEIEGFNVKFPLQIETKALNIKLKNGTKFSLSKVNLLIEITKIFSFKFKISDLTIHEANIDDKENQPSKSLSIFKNYIKDTETLKGIDGTFCLTSENDSDFSAHVNAHFECNTISLNVVYQNNTVNIHFSDPSDDPIIKNLKSLECVALVKENDIHIDSSTLVFKEGQISINGKVEGLRAYLNNISDKINTHLNLSFRSDFLKNINEDQTIQASLNGCIQGHDFSIDLDFSNNNIQSSTLNILINNAPKIQISKQKNMLNLNVNLLQDTDIYCGIDDTFKNGTITFKKTGKSSLFENSVLSISQNKDQSYLFKGDIKPIGENIIRLNMTSSFEKNFLDGTIFLNIKDMAPLTTPFDFATVGRIKGDLNFKQLSFCNKSGELNIDLHSKFFRSPLFKAELTTIKGKVLGQKKTDILIEMADLAIGKGFFAEQSILNIKSNKELYHLALKSRSHKKGYLSADVDIDIDLTFDLLKETLDIKKLFINHAKQIIQTNKPTHIELSPFKIETVNLSINKGSIVIKDVEAPSKVQQSWKGIVDIKDMSVEILSWFFPKTILVGDIDGTLNLSGDNQKPDFDLSLKGKKLQWLQFQGLASQTKHFVNFDFNASSFNDCAKWKLKLDGDALINFISEGTIPFNFSCHNNLTGKLKGSINLALISAIIGSGDRLSGNIDVDLDLSGNVDAPTWKGKISTHKSYIELAEFGTVINNIKGDIRAEGNRFIIKEITGNDDPLIKNKNNHQKGSLLLKGEIVFKKLMEPLVNLNLKVKDFLLVNSDSLVGTGTGDVTIQGDGIFSTVKGNVDVKSLSVNIDTLETDDDIPVIKLKDPKKRTYAKNYQKEKGHIFSKPILPLNLVLKSNNSISIFGKIIEKSLWGGGINVKGPIHDPYLEGNVHLVKGNIDFFGKNLKLDKGSATFIEEEKNEPWFLIEASRKIGDISIVLKIDNKQNPPFAFDSSPSMSRDEILSWLLFGKSAGTVSVGQSVQLATALAKLKGNTLFSSVDILKKGFGIDTFDIREQSGRDHSTPDQTQNQVIHLGKKITDNIEVTVEQGTAQGTGKFGVEMDVGKNVFVSLDVAGSSNNSNSPNASNTPSTNNSGVSITWDKRY
ncbi:MAG: translocation/assembly module TamB domain-containing protein [Proteobacteria bacterium]|nr:translocation/assembly module TamB domain-containing protein [Pseudomonadota bacterium]